MNSAELYLFTYQDIAAVIERPSAYEILRASALLRQLLVDRNRLVDVVNRRLRVPISFAIADSWETPYSKLVMSQCPVFRAVLEELDPDRMMTKAPVKSLSRDQFLAHNVIYVGREYVSIHGVIDHCANVLGGVHLGKPKKPSQELLAKCNAINIGGHPVPTVQLLPILRIVHRALRPLTETLRIEL